LGAANGFLFCVCSRNSSKNIDGHAVTSSSLCVFQAKKEGQEAGNSQRCDQLVIEVKRKKNDRDRQNNIDKDWESGKCGLENASRSKVHN